MFRLLYYCFSTCDITERVTLAHPIPGRPISPAVDASDYAIGAALQQRVNDKWQPLRFVTKSLTSAQQKYREYDSEFLAMYIAVKRFIRSVNMKPEFAYRWP